MLAAPAGPLGSFPAQQLRPGSAFGVGYASGDIAASAIGTVAYTDGDRVWGFGHPLDGVGARSLLLQDAYVFRVVNNPLALGDIAGTYKYAAAGHDVGTLTNDALDAVVGRVGGAAGDGPGAGVRDRPRHRRQAHASSRTSPTRRPSTSRPAARSSSLLAPLAVTQAAGTVLGGSPARLTGRACFAITFAERAKPVRFCNRYVTDAPDALGAGNVVAARGERRPARGARADRRLQGRRRCTSPASTATCRSRAASARRSCAACGCRGAARAGQQGRARRSRCGTCAGGSSGAR